MTANACECHVSDLGRKEQLLRELYLLIAAGLKSQRCKLPIVPESTQESRCSLTADPRKDQGIRGLTFVGAMPLFGFSAAFRRHQHICEEAYEHFALTLFLFCDAHSINDLA
jgi:hypothetical protein